MVKIRLARGGKKKAPFYHVVATDERRARDAGSCIERLGFFNPVAKGQAERLRLNLERIEYWLGTGAQTSDRVKSLIEEQKNGRKPKKVKKAKAPAPVAQEAEAEEPVAAEGEDSATEKDA